MKYWMIVLGLAACVSGCSSQNSSTVDSTLQTTPSGSGQGKPVSPGELPYFDWDALDGISAVQSNAVIVSAGSKQYSDANLLVTLRGQAHSTSEHPIVQVRWWQFSGPRAVIANPHQLHTQVLLPEVVQPAVAVFRFAAINAIGEVNSTQATVVIQPLSAPVKVTAVGLAEEDSEITFTVSLAEPAQELIRFDYFTEDGTASVDEDYLSMRGVLTFHPGQTHQPISVRLLQDNVPEPGEVFYLNLRGELGGETIELRRLGLIVDPLADRNLLSSVPVTEPIEPGTDGLPGQDGEPRLLLRWAEGGMVRLVVEDPCGNVLAGTEQSTPCHGTSPLVQTGTLSGEYFSYFENMAWTSGAASGAYKVYLEHVAGQAVEYNVQVHGLNTAVSYRGLMANGERVDITEWLHDGSGNPAGNRVTGSILNATNTAPVATAEVRFYQGETLVLEESVSAQFDMRLGAGTYRMVVTAEGFVEWSREVRVTADEALSVQVSLSPVLNMENEVARVVLSWGATPSDLDSHLLGTGTEAFHLFYTNKNVGGAQLDVDDTSAYGPETITIRSWNAERYRYYVKDYSNGGNPLSTALANSNAVVQLYLGEDVAQVFPVPQTAGVIWHVFDLDPQTGELTVVNRILGSESELPVFPADGQ
jgi:hypothetical protein